MTVALVVLVAGGAAGDAVGDFIERHWRTPIAPQGPPPPRYSELEASLAPEACGTCHPAQLADWKTSLHSKSMGRALPGSSPTCCRPLRRRRRRAFAVTRRWLSRRR